MRNNLTGNYPGREPETLSETGEKVRGNKNPVAKTTGQPLKGKTKV
jgi:hypothetical protein